jgi:alkyl hydroperoxide reductase subunit AhpF
LPRWGKCFAQPGKKRSFIKVVEKLLNEEVSDQIQQIFSDLKEPVEMLFFGQKVNCEYCDDTLRLVDEIAGLSDKISLSAYDIEADEAIAKQYKIDKVPGIVLAGRDGDQLLDYGVRYAGIPSGHEFSSLIHDLVLVSGRLV